MSCGPVVVYKPAPNATPGTCANDVGPGSGQAWIVPQLCKVDDRHYFRRGGHRYDSPHPGGIMPYRAHLPHGNKPCYVRQWHGERLKAKLHQCQARRATKQG